jgi:NADH:ubiquinone oxidoreductase subunit 5 (subunit L)/multisubunit Na+/H+ antiporter MnhA subunit
LCGGAVQHRTGTADLGKLGGLGKLMPVTFFSFLIAAFAISGIPPFNGFFSKWMVYQGLVEVGKAGGYLWIVWMVAAMFGSGLTLASFMKLTHTIFLGVPDHRIESQKIKEVSPFMGIPMVLLAFLCVLFGIFAYSIPVKHFLIPSVSQFSYPGIWSPGLATMMIGIGILLGLIIYAMGKMTSIREADSFIGGEKLPESTRVTGTGFYETIRNMKGVRKIYAWADVKRFDIYDVTGTSVTGIIKFLRGAHSGVLTSYMAWFIIGLVILLLVVLSTF